MRENDENKNRVVLCSEIGRTDIFKKSVLPKGTYRFDVIPYQKPWWHFSQS